MTKITADFTGLENSSDQIAAKLVSLASFWDASASLAYLEDVRDVFNAQLLTPILNGDLAITWMPLANLLNDPEAWVAATFFAESQVGLTMLPDLARADVAGETPAAFGGPVGRVSDNSLNARHLIQATGAAQPAFGRRPTSGLRNRLPNSGKGVASAGVVGAGGALPSYWSVTNMPAGSVEVLSLAEKNGRPCVRIRINGIPTGSPRIRFASGVDQIPVETSQDWVHSVWLQRVGGDQTNINAVFFNLIGDDAGGNNTGGISSTTLSDTLADDVRRSTAGTISNPAIASIRGEISLSWASGAIDITLDVSAPQLEIGVEATDVQITAADNFAVTQSGQPSVDYIRFDGVSDMLRTASVFAGGLNGQAFVLGDAGCMVSDLSIAAGGDFIFGPTTWNGAPAGAVETVSGGTGRILGAVIRAGAFSEDEIDRLIRFARACGAGPLSEINPWQPQALGAGVVDLSRLDLAYTDTAGTLLAQPGQAVAALRDGNGAVVATQATSAARQTYGRHPASGIRNRAKRSADVGSAVAWPETNVANGITCTKAGSGIDTDGLPFVLYDVVGTATAVSFFSIVSPDLTRSAALSGQTWTGSYLVQRVSGAAPGNAQTGVRIDVRGETAPNSETEATFGEPVAPATETLRTISRTLDNAATNQVRANLAIRVENGDTVDFRVKIKALQFEQGGVRSVYQAALSEFDISEAGQRSVYYLKPDGIDDWMSFATPFAPNGPFTLAAIVNGGTGFPAPMCFGSAGGLSSYNLAHGAGVRMDGNANSVVFDPANDPAWQALEGTRRVDVARINGAASAESWRNGQEYAGTPTVLGDILAVAGFDTLFRSGGSYGSTRFYGGALIPAAITEPQRLLLQTYLASKGGISL